MAFHSVNYVVDDMRRNDDNRTVPKPIDQSPWPDKWRHFARTSRRHTGTDPSTEDEARSSIESRLSDPTGFLTGDGISVTDENLMRAREALAYQPWRTVWESAKTIIGATSGPDYEALLRNVFASMPVHLIAGQRSSEDWPVPGWAREQAATFTTLSGAGHCMMLEQPAPFGRALAAALEAVTR